MAEAPAQSAGRSRPPNSAYEVLKFRFGFLLYRQGEFDPGAIAAKLPVCGWRRQDLGPFTLCAHPEAQTTVLGGEGHAVLIVGDAYEPETGAPPVAVPASGDAGLFGFADRLGGRFALVAIEGERARVLHDAIGSRSVYYHRGPRFAVASHALLLARVTGAARREDVADLLEHPAFATRKVKYLPGDWTPFDGIYGLAPNNLFDSVSLATRRYWPRAVRSEGGEAYFQRTADRYLASLASYVAKRYVPVFGLTAGVDSRLVIAAFRARGVDYETVTWCGGSLGARERPVVERLAAYLGCPHHYVDLGARRAGGAAGIAARNGSGVHPPSATSPLIAQRMWRHYRDMPPRAFLRCWGAEVMRGFYNLRRTPMTSLEPSEMARAFDLDSRAKRDDAYRRLVRSGFEEFYERANYAGVAACGYDPNDLFYWEHRMGMWGSASNNILDPAMTTIIGLNSRPLFAASFGISAELRLSKNFFLRLMARYDPGLAAIALDEEAEDASPEPAAAPIRGRFGALRRRLGL